jgi:hypothetical protein
VAADSQTVRHADEGAQETCVSVADGYLPIEIRGSDGASLTGAPNNECARKDSVLTLPAMLRLDGGL